MLARLVLYLWCNMNVLFRFSVWVPCMCAGTIWAGRSLRAPGSFSTVNGSEVLGRDGVQVPSWTCCPVYVAANYLAGLSSHVFNIHRQSTTALSLSLYHITHLWFNKSLYQLLRTCVYLRVCLQVIRVTIMITIMDN
jgi:hypothetical protein